MWSEWNTNDNDVSALADLCALTSAPKQKETHYLTFETVTMSGGRWPYEPIPTKLT